MRSTNLISIVGFSLLLSACGLTSSTISQSDSESNNTAVNENAVQPTHTLSRVDFDQSLPNQKVFTIKHHKIECEGSRVKHCLLAKEDDGSWKFFYHQIEGFDYQWGVESKILVEVNDESERSAGMRSKYRLLSVLSTSDQKSGTDFHYVARGGHEGIKRIGDQQYSLRGDKTFSCAPQVCSTIDSMLNQQQSVLLSFSHAKNVDGPLVLESVLCTSSPGTFSKSCTMPDYSS